MPEISAPTLMMAIQAVDQKIRKLVKQLEDDDSPEMAEFELLLLSYENAAMELKAGYEEARKHINNFPPYDTLVKD